MVKGDKSNEDKSPRPVTISKPLNWSTSSFSQQVRSLRFAEDDDGNVWAMPVVLFDVNPVVAAGVAVPEADRINPWGKFRLVNNEGSIAVDVTSPSLLFSIYNGALLNMALGYAADSTTVLKKNFTPDKWKSSVIAAAPATTDIWTPTAGYKFRVLGGVICMGGLIAAAAVRNLTLIEETAGTVVMRTSITIPVLGNNIAIPFTLGPSGFLASTADKKLQCVTAGATYTAGQDSVYVYGTEEV